MVDTAGICTPSSEFDTSQDSPACTGQSNYSSIARFKKINAVQVPNKLNDARYQLLAHGYTGETWKAVEWFLCRAESLQLLGDFYLKKGQRTRLPPELGSELLRRLDAASAALPAA